MELSLTKKKKDGIAVNNTWDNNSTGGLYQQFVGTDNYSYGTGTLQHYSTGLNSAGLTGNVYGDVLTPGLTNNPTENVYTNAFNSGVVGNSDFIDGASVKVDNSSHLDGNVVGTVGGGLGSGVPSTGTGTGDSTPTTPTDTKPETGETSTMTYEQYIAEQKAREEEKRQAALKEAEIYKERAEADAQASYMQNMSTYGVNAENMAKMGLTGGGYSDYFNSQAYAQKRGDLQTADRNYFNMQQQANTTYRDGIAALEKEKFAYQEQEAEVSLDGEKTPFVVGDVIKDIQNGLMVKKDGTNYTWDEIHEMLLQERNAGATVTKEDIANAKTAYDRWIFYKQGNITTENYYDAQYGDEEANTQITRDMTTEQLKQDAKNKVGDMLGYAKGYYDKYGALDIYASGFKPENFGDFTDADDPDSKQGKYTQKIIDDAKAGKIPVGSFVTINYGASASDNGNYIYMGDGIFVKLPWNGSIKSAIKDYASQFGDFSVYIPDGYKLGGWGGTIREK